MKKTNPYYGKSMSINFPELPQAMGFIAFSCTVRNVWENPRISHVIKYTIGSGSNGRNEPILLEKHEYQFPRISPYYEFCCIFPYCDNCMGKCMHFPYGELYHRMGI